MSQANDPDVWQRGSAYERYVGRWSRRVAVPFVEWLGVPPSRFWLDVGCGTGALCATILERCAPASVSAVEPSEGFLVAAREHLAGKAVLYRGSATAIPLPPSSVDAVVSGLVLNFVDDPAAALEEMARVAVPGGTVAAYVWDYAGSMEYMRHFWDAAVAIDPDARAKDEGVRFPLCNPTALARCFTAARLDEVEVVPIDIATTFADFDDCWEPFLGGQGPAPAYAMSLPEPARERLREGFRGRLAVRADGSIALVARAWAVRGSIAR